MSNGTLQKMPGNELATNDTARAATLTPRIDILETESELLVFADLPGVNQDDVDIRFENGELTLHAKRSFSNPQKSTLLWETEHGDYFRAFRISDQIAGDKISAELRNGVLALHLPKVETAKPRKIAVK